MTQTSGHIFLSHGSENRDEAEGLTRYLEQRGLRVWIAPRDVRPGVDYSEALQQAIEVCAAFVVLVTDKANKSPYVRVETEMAFSLHKPIFPIRTTDVKPGPGLALFLKIRHWTDAYGPHRDESLERLARELRSIAGVPDPAPAAEPAAAVREAAAAPVPDLPLPPVPPTPSRGAAPARDAPRPQPSGPARPGGGVPPMVVVGVGLFLLVLAALFVLLRPATGPAEPVPQPVPQPSPQPRQAPPADPGQPAQPGAPGDVYYTPPDQPGEQPAEQRPPQEEPPAEGFYDPPQ